MSINPSDDRPFNRLSPAVAEALYLLSEECGELQQAIGKILRHGLWSAHPDSEIPNQVTLEREIGDVLASLRICEVQKLLKWAAVIRYRDDKLRRVPKYLHHAKVIDDE